MLVGHPDYDVTGGTATFKGENLFEKEPEERSHAGLFLSFQTPVEIPGVSNMDFLRMACNARRKALGLPEFGPLEVYHCLRSPSIQMFANIVPAQCFYLLNFVAHISPLKTYRSSPSLNSVQCFL